MRIHRSQRAIWAGLLGLVGLGLGVRPGLAAGSIDSPTSVPRVVAPAQAPAIAPKAVDPQTPAAALEQALDLERHGNWSAAIAAYEEALKQWPRADFRHRLRLCEIHYRLGRRYQDRSFRDVLLKLPADRAMELYDELLERIDSHYVEAVALAPLLRRGLDNLDVALRDPSFLRANAPNLPPDRALALRESLRKRRAAVLVKNRPEAEAEVRAIAEVARQGAGLASSPVILEFVFGACDALDDYTTYLTPDKLDDLYSMIDGNFVGLGVELKQDDQGLRLVGVLPDGPASDAGMRAGDRITAVGGQKVGGLGLDEAANRLQGSEGTTVRVTVLHADGSEQTLELTRRAVEVRSVTQAKIVESVAGVGYVQLTGFQKSSTEELERAIASLQRQGMRFLVLDLRGNPGGLLNVAVEMADRFLDDGVIVSTRGRAPGQSSIYRARPGALWRMPVAVLIDRDSASASEILAGALKENHRALILGQRSYGKGSVQSIYSLRTAPAGLKLTTAKFYSPTDRAYSEQGVEPHQTSRTVLKPMAGDDGPSATFGDPDTDPVLDSAIEVAKRRTAKAAG